MPTAPLPGRYVLFIGDGGALFEHAVRSVVHTLGVV